MNLNVTEWKLLCPSAEALTEEEPITNDAGCPVSKALYEALHERPPSQCLSAGAILSTLLAQSCRSLGGYRPHLINPSRNFCVQSCEYQELRTATKCTDPKVCKLWREGKFPKQYNQQFVTRCP